MALWKPDKKLIEQARVTKFIRRIEDLEKRKFRDFYEFRSWTVENPGVFWREVAYFTGMIFSKSPQTILTERKHMMDASWFEGASLNFAENLLRFDDEQIALVSWGEKGRRCAISYSELRRSVGSLQQRLIALGLQKGDYVCACMPNISETIIAMLAVTGLGAVWSSCSPDFSQRAMADRFGQLSPKIIFTIDGYLYKGKAYSILSGIRSLLDDVPSIRTVLIFPCLSEEPDTSDIPSGSVIRMADISPGSSIDGQGQSTQSPRSEISPVFDELPAQHPLYVLFSSGTTGLPKGIVHSTVGILLEHAKEHALEVNINRDDVVFYNTTCGWMMWNWLASSLFQGCTIVLYDGFPLANDGQILFEMADKERITVFGTSAGFIQKLQELGVEPGKSAEIRSIRSILSTGSRLKPESFEYIYKEFGRIHLSPIWGGTDLCGCLGLSSPVLPVHKGEIQTAGLGIALDVVNEKCESLRDEPGEVIVRKPFPSMPLHFLNDPDRSKYFDAYFRRFAGVWSHGDEAVINSKTYGITVLGRSDDILNPGGVRIGPAEITNVAEQMPGVLEAIAVAQKWGNDERIVLFLKLDAGKEADVELQALINSALPSPRHRPAKIVKVDDFPTTLSGKRSSKTIRDIINGKQPGNLDALANPLIIKTYLEIYQNLLSN